MIRTLLKEVKEYKAKIDRNTVFYDSGSIV